MEQGQKKTGFTLIELLICIAIAGILVSLAAPSFRSATEKAQRIAAQLTLVSAHMQQQQYYLQNGRYASSGDITLPTNDNYIISIENASANTFTLVAKARRQLINNNSCASLTLDDQMEKTPLNCWR